jgi:hypothetical protein
MINASQIKEHMEVRSADGKHVGAVDHMEGSDKIKLTKSDQAAHAGHHHFIPLSWVERVDKSVHLSKSYDDVMAGWQHEKAA